MEQINDTNTMAPEVSAEEAAKLQKLMEDMADGPVTVSADVEEPAAEDRVLN